MWKTIDGGATWQPAWDQEQYGRRLVMDPSDPLTLYAAPGLVAGKPNPSRSACERKYTGA
jgi:hypothetical protein